MAQEEKQVLLKDLYARILYGFTVHRYSDNRDITFGPNELDEFAHFLEYSEGKEFKPYLRPMSSMTEEERNDFYHNRTFHDGRMWESEGSDVDWLNAHHFDYRGLIPMGLALEAPEGMYETD